MAKYIIKGGVPLKGTIKISGNKNAVFPCIAAALLTKDTVILKNVPDIDDVKIMLEILQNLGVEANLKNSSLSVSAKNIKSYALPSELMRKLRGSIVLVGPLLSRIGKAKFSFPGGDIIGKRSIATHLQSFKDLGFKVTESDLKYSIARSNIKGSGVFLDEPSVTATECLILSLVLGSNRVVLKNCAKEPSIVDLCRMLNKMGAKIEGIGGPTLKIKGVNKLFGTTFTIGPDYLEMVTYSAAAALTGGEVILKNCRVDDLEPVTRPLAKMGIGLLDDNKGLRVACKTINPKNLKTNIWPGFPTDLMSVFIVLATQARGVSLMHDWMYESRMFFADKLINMGANITIADPHRVFVYGPTKLIGRDLETPDIRAGMALVLAALIAKGQSVINKAELIDRGYEDVALKLSSLGADIEKVD